MKIHFIDSRVVLLTMTTLALGAFGSGCGSGTSTEQGQLGKHIVCDPFNKTTTLTSKSGIIGTISSINPALIASTPGVLALEASGTVYDATLVLNQLNVPTIEYDQGFTSTDGRPLWNTGGGAVSEYFALHLEGQLDVPSGQEGYYQFALVSDDGAIFQVNDGSGFRTVVDNDGLHMTRFRAGGVSDVVLFTAGAKIPFKLDYYQGQLKHLALTLLWRKVSDTVTVPGATEVALDPNIPTYADNSVFWTPGKTPEASWAVETASGSAPGFTNWGIVKSSFSVIPSDRFSIPETIESNPCN